MAKNYEAPVSVRELEKMLNNFTYHNGFEMSRVFDDWLIYIIFNFTPNPQPNPDWKYKPEHNKVFNDMMLEWVKAMDKEISENSWFDAFGILYEACIVSNSRASNSGQFFTPACICDMLTQVTYNGEMKGKGLKINDPTCGSGRTLLSFQIQAPGNYLVGEDLDRTCVLMTVCNFIIHGVMGEVVWHDSLRPETYYGGYRVNKNLNNPMHRLNGLPHVEPMTKEQSFVWKQWEAVRLDVEAKKQAPKEIMKPKKEPEKVIIIESTKHVNQLALF